MFSHLVKEKSIGPYHTYVANYDYESHAASIQPSLPASTPLAPTQPVALKKLFITHIVDEERVYGQLGHNVYETYAKMNFLLFLIRFDFFFYCVIFFDTVRIANCLQFFFIEIIGCVHKFLDFFM